MSPTFHRNYLPVSVDVLTPVAIGSGQILDPMSYTLCKEEKDYALHLVDVEEWLLDNADDAGLSHMLESNQFLQIRKRIHQDLEKPEVRQSYSVAKRLTGNANLYGKFVEEMNKGNQSQNQLQIASGLRNPLTNRLILAGSSIKGAIRTAVLDYLDHKYELRLKQIEERQLQRTIDDQLGKISDHAFKSLRVQDCEMLQEQSCLVSAEEKRLNDNNRPGTPKAPTEAISQTRSGSTLHRCPVTTLTLGFNADSSGALTIEAKDKIRNKEVLNWTKLCEIVTSFYRKRFREEFDKFYRKSHLQTTGSLLEPTRQKIENLPEGSMLLRVGHYSHSECLTIRNGSPRGKNINGRVVGPGTTRTLADGVWPFGWIILSPSNEAALKEYRGLLDDELTTQKDFIQQLEADRVKAVEAAREKELEVEQARKLEQVELSERQKAQDSMSAVDKLIDELRNGRIVQESSGSYKNQIPDYESEYTKISEFTGDDLIKLAQLYKEFFERDQKWSGKMSQKQEEKVKRISEILADSSSNRDRPQTKRSSQESDNTNKPWPNKKKTLPVWIQDSENLQKLSPEKLKELKEDVRKVLKNKGFASVELIDQRLKELDDA